MSPLQSGSSTILAHDLCLTSDPAVASIFVSVITYFQIDFINIVWRRQTLLISCITFSHFTTLYYIFIISCSLNLCLLLCWWFLDWGQTFCCSTSACSGFKESTVSSSFPVAHEPRAYPFFINHFCGVSPDHVFCISPISLFTYICMR